MIMLKNYCITYNLIISFLLFLMIEGLNIQQNYSLMLMYSINNMIVFSLFLYYELKNYEGINLNLLLLIAYFVRLYLPSVSMSLDACMGITLYYDNNRIDDFVFPTIIWMNIVYTTFYFLLSKFTSKYTIDEYIIPFFYKYNILSLSVFLYIIGNVYNIIVSNITDAELFIPSFLSQILSKFTILAILLQMLNTIYRYSTHNYYFFVVFVLFNILYSIFFGFFKSALIIPILIYCWYYFLDCKSNGKRILNIKFVVLICFTLFFTKSFVYPFMSAKRSLSGFNVGLGKSIGATREYSNIEIMSDVISGKIKKNDKHSAFDRLNSISTNAFFYKAVVKRGRYDHKILINNMKMLIPRFLYPEKGINSAGLMAESYAKTGSFNNYKRSKSNIYVGQFAGSFLNGGYILVIIMSIINPIVISLLFKTLLKNISNIFAILFLSNLLMATVFGFEEVHDGGIQRCISYSIIIIFVKLSSYFVPHIKIDDIYENPIYLQK